MGQVDNVSVQSLILSATDRLIASNADGGLSPGASHIILLGETAGQNLGPLTNIIAMGDDTLSAGMTSVTQNGTTVIGSKSLALLTNATVPPTSNGPILGYGVNIFPLQVSRIGNDVFIGDSIGVVMPAAGAETDGVIIIGNNAIARQKILAANYGAGVGYVDSVIVGDKALRGQAFANAGAGVPCVNSVVLGAQAAANAGFDSAVPGTTFTGNVLIGFQAALNAATTNAATFQNTVAIGNAIAPNIVTSSQSVFIGSGQTIQGTSGSDHVTIGSNVVGNWVAASTGNIGIGAGASFSGIGSGNILIGTNCNGGGTLAAASQFQLLIESGIGAKRTAIYGLMANATPGGLILGNSTDGVDRDIPGFNIVKLINGSKNGTPPVGGGFFYGTGGIIHWVDTAAGPNDYDLTKGGSLGTFAVAALPAAPPAGSRAYVNDAAAPAWNAAPAGGGAIFVPVFYNGAAWRCG